MLTLKQTVHYYLKSSRTNTDGTKCQMLKRILTVLKIHMALSYYKHESTGIHKKAHKCQECTLNAKRIGSSSFAVRIQ